MWWYIDCLQSLIEGTHVTHVNIAMCPLSMCCPPIILHSLELTLECTAGSFVCNLGSLVIRFCKLAIVAGVFLFKEALGFLYLLHQTSLGVFLTKGPQLQLWFPVVWSSPASTFLQALQLWQNKVSPPTWLEDCFSPLGHEVCVLAASSCGFESRTRRIFTGYPTAKKKYIYRLNFL